MLPTHGGVGFAKFLGNSRKLRLILEAHLGKYVDYANFNSRRIDDLIREKFVFETLERKIYEKLTELDYTRKCGALGYSPAFDMLGEAFKHTSKDADRAFRRLGAAVAPWIDWGEKESGKLDNRSSAELLAKWEEKFGSMTDPVVQERLRTYERIANANKVPENAHIIRR